MTKGPTVSPGDVTALLGEWSRGNRTALAELLPLVLMSSSSGALRRGSFGTSGLTTPCSPLRSFMRWTPRLVGQRQVDWHNPAHFFGVAAQVMRRIDIHHARRYGASKRGRGRARAPIHEARQTSPASHEIPFLALHDKFARSACKRSTLNSLKSSSFRVFGGLTIEEAARVLTVSPSTAKRDWRAAKAWLTL